MYKYKEEDKGREKDKNLKYACVYIELQKFENFFSLKEALYKGTIFEDLYRPYKKEKSKKSCKCF